jgi:hypothetical protein
MTRNETNTVLTRISAIWGRRPANPTVTDEWFKALASYPAPWANTTLDTMIRTGATGPTLPEFVALVRTNLPRPSTEPEPDTDFTPVPADRVHQLLAEGIEQGRAQRFARALLGDPDVLARLLRWRES